METIGLNVQAREKRNKGHLKSIRRSGLVPCVLYHSGEKAIIFSINLLELRPLIYTNESHIVTLKFQEGTEKQAILKQASFDPVTSRVIHVDFLEIRADEIITIEVPIAAQGIPEGVRLEGGMLSITQHKIPIKCKPADILGHINVDVTPLKLGESVHMRDIQSLLDPSKYSIAGDPSSLVLYIASKTKVEATATEQQAAVAPEAEADVKAKPDAKEGKSKE